MDQAHRVSPLATVTFDGYRWQPGSEAPLDLFELGVTQPTAENTGPRFPDDELYFHNGNITTLHPVTGALLAPGDVIEKVYVTGYVRPVVAGLTFNDVVATDEDEAWVGIDYRPIFDQRAAMTGYNTYNFCEARAATSDYRNVGWQGGNFVANRCKVTNVTDSFSPHGSSTVNKTVEINGCFADDFYTDTDPNQGDNITHNDGCQAQGRLSKLWVIGNSIGSLGNLAGRPRTSNVLLQSNAGGYVAGEGVKVNYNWFHGHATAGSTVNVPITGLNSIPFEFIGNRVSNTGHTPLILLQAGLRTATTSTISGNVVLETGAPVTINNA